MADHIKTEQDFEVNDDAQVPDLLSLPGVAAVGIERQELEATYFDVADRRLLASGGTLLRRTGGDDAGWQLKLPVGAHAPTEVREEIGQGRRIPAPLVDRARAYLRREQARPVAVLRTERTVTTLVDEAGRQLAKFSDDRIVSSAPPTRPDPQEHWREWKFELLDGEHTLLRKAARALRAAGGRETARTGKLARALGAPTPHRPIVDRRTEAGPVVVAYLSAQVESLLAGDPAVRVDAADSIHSMRVAARRLRSVLATFRPVLDRARTEPIRAELKWLGQLLGAARDDEVQDTTIAARITAEPRDTAFVGMGEWVRQEFSGQRSGDRRALLRALNSTRYLALLDALDELVARPPLTDQASRPAKNVLPQRVRRDFERARGLVKMARQAEGPAVDLALHDVRKAAKRLRYSAESLAPTFGGRLAAVAGAAENVQEVLGDHQDTVVARDLLREMATRAFRDGQNPFPLGRVHHAEEVRAGRAEAAFPPVWKALVQAAAGLAGH